MKTRKLFAGIFVATLGLLIVVQFVVIANLATINANLSGRSIIVEKESAENQQSELLKNLRREALTRAALYDQSIRQNFLLDGMVIQRDAFGQAAAVCDSLLFSSLRFYSLSRMGFNDAADEAWNSILKSRVGAQWQRHPQCAKSLSRDMVMGILVALSANPKNGTDVFIEMLSEIDRNWGFAGDGPFYVSWLSPGIASLLRFEAERRNIPFAKWPWNLKNSFSSIEFDALFLEEGYVSHLAALGLWLEMEHVNNSSARNPRSVFGRMQRLMDKSAIKDTALDDQRRKWITSRLRAIHGSNIFFEILDYKAYRDFTPEVEERLLKKLLAMPQFPATRTPMDCDRDADYIWQRKEAESASSTKTCREQWNGVDFLFAAALLGVTGEDYSTDLKAIPLQMNLSH